MLQRDGLTCGDAGGSSGTPVILDCAPKGRNEGWVMEFTPARACHAAPA